MMKRTFKRTLLLSSLLVFSSLISTGCFELNYKDTQQYYDLFNDTVYLFYANDNGTVSYQKSVSIEDDLFNDASVNDVHSVETIDEEYYEYLCIKPTELVTMQDLAVFVKATETARLAVKIYLLKILPDVGSLRAFGLKTKDDDGKDITYDDDFVKPVHISEITTKENLWESVYANTWEVDGRESKYIDVTITDYIVIQFLNNTGYGADLGYQPVKFSIVNLMVSPKNEKYAIDKN